MGSQLHKIQTKKFGPGWKGYKANFFPISVYLPYVRLGHLLLLPNHNQQPPSKRRSPKSLSKFWLPSLSSIWKKEVKGKWDKRTHLVRIGSPLSLAHSGDPSLPPYKWALFIKLHFGVSRGITRSTWSSDVTMSCDTVTSLPGSPQSRGHRQLCAVWHCTMGKYPLGSTLVMPLNVLQIDKKLRIPLMSKA